MTPAAKRAMEESYKEIRRGHGIAPQLVLLTVLELGPPDPAAELIAAVGVDRAAARQRLGVGCAAAWADQHRAANDPEASSGSDGRTSTPTLARKRHAVSKPRRARFAG
jgi:hypothetical protein